MHPSLIPTSSRSDLFLQDFLLHLQTEEFLRNLLLTLDIDGPNIEPIRAEIVEMTLVVSQFHFLRVGSRISKLRVIILPGMQILKVGSWTSNCSRFGFSFLKFYVAPSRIKYFIYI